MNAVDVTTQGSGLSLLRHVSANMVQCEVGADAVSDFPSFDVRSDCYNLTCAVGARNQIACRAGMPHTLRSGMAGRIRWQTHPAYLP